MSNNNDKKILEQLLKSGGGWDYKNEKIEESDAKFNSVFGAGTAQPKNWEQWLPRKENQYWTSFCVSFSILNCVETMARYLGITDEDEAEIDLSDRNLAVESGTTKKGNGLNPVAEWLRKKGAVKERECYFTPEMIQQGWEKWDEIFDMSDMNPKARRYMGPNHSWVNTDIVSLKNALAETPLQLAFGVGKTWENEIVEPPALIEAYHAVECYYIDDKYIYIYDSVFGRPKKKLTLAYPVLYAKSFRELPPQWKELNKKKLMTKEKLNIIYEELLLRAWNEAKDGLAYLDFDDDFVRQEVGKSKERQQIIEWVNMMRAKNK